MKHKNLLIGAGIAALVSMPLLPHFSRNSFTAEVAKKEFETIEKPGRYIVTAKMNDGSARTLEVSDSLLEWKFDSSGLYKNIEPGKSYNFKVYGWKLPFLPCYENIVAANDVSSK